MKNLLFLLFFLSILFRQGHSQVDDYYDRMEHVFTNIDPAKASTGLLKEFGIRFNEVEAYDGAISSTNWVDKTQWQSLYSSLHTMRVGGATTMTDPSTVFDHLESEQDASPNTVLLTAQYYNYEQYKSDAYSNGDVTVTNDQIYDVTGRDPYDTKTAFAVTPMKYHLTGNTFSFRLQSNMIYSNSSLTLSTVEVDFDDGQGYQNITLNNTKFVTYTTSGEKELKVKFVYSGGPTLYSHSKLWVDYLSGGSSYLRFDGNNIDTEVITGAAYQGATATGDITIEYAGNDQILDKPFIVVEGFDPVDGFDFYDFINRNDPQGIDIEVNITSGITLNDSIEDLDYDLVFVDFRNSRDYIQRNAYMVEAVIEWVNNNKMGNEQNVVMGMSMGGLVARYALRHMETTSRTHDTKLYVSVDAPHQGANVPLAFQAMVRHLVGETIKIPVFLSLFSIDYRDIKDMIPGLDSGLELLQSPAAQQMLIYQL